MKLAVIVGSTRQSRFSGKPAQWIYEVAKERGITVELLDLRDYPMPFFDEPMSPQMSKGKYSNEIVKKWAQKIAAADGYIIVSPEYNHGYPAVLKNAFDQVYFEWNKKPVGFVSYGTVGGARAVEQLRQVAVELQMAPIRQAIHVPFSVLLAIIKPQEDDTTNPLHALNDQASTFLDQLMWWASALKSAREAVDKPTAKRVHPTKASMPQSS